MPNCRMDALPSDIRSFFSSIDQHMQYSLQKDNPVCFGLVMDKDAQVRCLRLSAEGMEAVSKCENHNQAMFL